MRLLEYQAKAIFSDHGIPVPKGRIYHTPEEILNVMAPEGSSMVVKAQVPLGKRGKGGGIRFAPTAEGAAEAAKELLGGQIYGYPIDQVLVEPALNVVEEYYTGVITDGGRSRSCPVILFSTQGGMEIEELAAGDPGAIKELPVDPLYGPAEYQIRSLLKASGIAAGKRQKLTEILRALYQVYWEYDAELAEINPLGLTDDNSLVALDAKLVIDNSALFRHPSLPKTEYSTIEAKASRVGLSYVELGGDIGIISNGAGLTMATIDQITRNGGRPANFMDTGERILRNGIADGFNLLLERGGLKGILVNVFGGGVRCDVIAGKIIDYLACQSNFTLPVVACLQGRNAEAAREVISKSLQRQLRLVSNMDEAIAAVVSLEEQP